MIPYKYNIQMDFIEEYLNLCRCRLKESGYVLNSNKDADFKLFNFQKRSISPQKRKVLISTEFKCPKEFQNGLRMLKRRIENGENIEGYLGKEILNLNYNDNLLNDWGIHHLHLGEKKERIGKFVERTGPLLFAKFEDDKVYFINIYNHGCWSKQEMLRILYKNWPSLIKPFIAKNINSTTQISDNEYSNLRKNNGLAMVEIDNGVVCLPLGMGYMSSGESLEVIMNCDKNRYRLRIWEKNLRTNIDDIVKKTQEKKGKQIGNTFKFHLWLEKDEFFAIEFNYGIEVKLGRLD